VSGRGVAQLWPVGIAVVVVVDGCAVVVACSEVVDGFVVVVADVTDVAQLPIPSRRQRLRMARRQLASRSAKTPHVVPHCAIVGAQAARHCARDVAVAGAAASNAPSAAASTPIIPPRSPIDPRDRR
jgi:hypothetical protein